MVAVAGALLFEVFLRFGRAYLMAWAGARHEHLSGCAAIGRLLESNLADFEKDPPGVHLDRLRAFAHLRDFSGGQPMVLMIDLPFALLFIAIIAYLGRELVLVPVALLALFGVAAAWMGARLKAALARRTEADDRRFNFIIEVLGGVHTVKAMAMEPFMVRRYERLQHACARATYDVVRASNDAMSLGSAFAQLTTVLVVAAGSLKVIDGTLTVGGLSACMLLSSRAMQPLQRALGLWTRFQSIRIACRRVRELFAIPAEGGEGGEALEIQGRIEFKGVGFTYPGDAEPTIVDANLEIAPGETVAITGKDGAGKTTLIYLMMGALRPSSGEVLIDGRPVSAYEPRALRAQVAFLPQRGVLFQGTILDNLTNFRSGDYAEVALELASRSGLDRVVARLPKGYDTRVGEAAFSSLPFGISQRIAIVRALVDRPRIVLFDAANEGLDAAGETVLKDLLVMLKNDPAVTLVIVSHRPSLLELADRVFTCRAGRIAASEITLARAPGPAGESNPHRGPDAEGAR